MVWMDSEPLMLTNTILCLNCGNWFHLDDKSGQSNAAFMCHPALPRQMSAITSVQLLTRRRFKSTSFCSLVRRNRCWFYRTLIFSIHLFEHHPTYEPDFTYWNGSDYCSCWMSSRFYCRSHQHITSLLRCVCLRWSTWRKPRKKPTELWPLVQTLPTCPSGQSAAKPQLC